MNWVTTKIKTGYNTRKEGSGKLVLGDFSTFFLFIFCKKFIPFVFIGFLVQETILSAMGNTSHMKFTIVLRVGLTTLRFLAFTI